MSLAPESASAPRAQSFSALLVALALAGPAIGSVQHTTNKGTGSQAAAAPGPVPVLYVTNSSVTDCTPALLSETADEAQDGELWAFCNAALNLTRASKQGGQAHADAHQEWQFDVSTRRWTSEDGLSLEAVPKSLAPHPGFVADHGRARTKSERAVFGNDDRVLVNSTHFPYSAIGMFKNPVRKCTAVLIFANIIITTANCVLDDNFQVYPIPSMTFYLGESEDQALAVSGIDAVWPSYNFQTKAGCPFACHFTDEDYALLRLRKPLGYVYGWMGVVNFDPVWQLTTCEHCDQGMELAGYSQDAACDYGDTACTHKGCSLVHEVIYDVESYSVKNKIYQNINVTFAQHDCDSQFGTGGAPLFAVATGHIYGINAYHYTMYSNFPVYSVFSVNIANKAVASGRFFEDLLIQIINEEANYGNDFASAFFIPTLGFLDVGSTTNFSDRHASTAGRDVFYFFNPLDTITAVVDTCDSSFDTVLFVYSWAEEEPSLVNSSDSGCGAQSRIEMTFMQGVEYVIVLDGYDSDSHGEYVFRMTCAPSSSSSDMCIKSADLSPPSPPSSCANNCGAIDSSGCFCDALCTSFDDCCFDAFEMCAETWLGLQPVQPDSCKGYCGGQQLFGCFCDDSCTIYDDCCPDVIEQCLGALPPSATPQPLISCHFQCGVRSSSGCSCDDYCTFANDCCADAFIHCGLVPSSPFDPLLSFKEEAPGSSDPDAAGDKQRVGLGLVGAVLVLQGLLLLGNRA